MDHYCEKAFVTLAGFLITLCCSQPGSVKSHIPGVCVVFHMLVKAVVAEVSLSS